MAHTGQSWTNRETKVQHPISLPAWGIACSAAQSLIAQCPNPQVAAAEADRSRAQNQLPLLPDHGRLAAKTLRGPRSDSWRAFPPNTCPSRGGCDSGYETTKSPPRGSFRRFGLVTPPLPKNRGLPPRFYWAQRYLQFGRQVFEVGAGSIFRIPQTPSVPVPLPGWPPAFFALGYEEK